jgi:hypothetical protein|tara:strand:+ start:278 stop:631 length:354 start_codon:yes stop_codon:yes gene_type:complete
MDKNEMNMRSEDFLIRVRPFKDIDGSWNGDIDLSIITQPSNDLTDEDYNQVMHFCKMMASTVPLMERDEELRDMVHNFVVEHVDKEYVIEVDSRPRVIDREDNVVTIDFGTKTKGSA